MILAKYNCYKDAGVEWLGDVPKEWEVKRTKAIFNEICEKSKQGTELLLTVSHITGVTPRKEKNVNMFFAESMEGYKICQKGDLIINTMWAWMGALGISEYNGICSPAYGVYRCYNSVEFYPRYFEYLFGTPNFILEMTRHSKGIVSSRLRLYPSEFFKIKTVFPKKIEQIQISNFLDKTTLQIDTKIKILQDKKRSYEEFKKTLIDETVCYGLNKNVELKDLEIQWIEKTPLNWIIEKLKDSHSIYTGNSIADKELYTIADNSIPYIATKDIETSKNNINYKNGVYIPKDNKNFKIAKKGSTLLCIEGGSAGKKVATINKNVCFVNKLCAIKSKKTHLNDKFIFYFLKSSQFKNQFFSNITGLIGGVSIGLIKMFFIAVPPIEEQIEIANYLDEKTSQLDIITTKITDQINTLTEFRKTLINDVVIGKVRAQE